MQKQLRLKTAELEKTTHQEFFNIAVSVDCVILGYEDRQLKVMLIRSDLKEFAGLWSLLGDLVKPNEDIDEAPYRVLQARTGLQDVYLEQVHTFGKVDRHPSGRVITIAYYSLLNLRHLTMPAGNNELCWHAVHELDHLAFDHKLILNTCIQRLQEQVMEKPIIFNLLPEKFSLRELQDAYEAILGSELDRRNFRKRIMLKDWLVDLNEMEQDVPHRPGKLYKVKPQLKRIHSASKAKKGSRAAL